MTLTIIKLKTLKAFIDILISMRIDHKIYKCNLLCTTKQIIN